MRVAVLITSFNRRDLTLLALRRLFEQSGAESFAFEVFLLDDNSSDGTSQAVARLFPAVHLLHGNGSMFWNGGMRQVFAEALSRNFDAYILFNDDTLLDPDALERLVAASLQSEEVFGPAIVVASFRDAVTGEHSYGGLLRHTRGLRLEFRPAPPDEDAFRACDTMNGNFTLIPAAIIRQLGNLDPTYQHQFGDWDYGLRATKCGIPIRIAPGYFGTCSDNSRSGTWRDRSLPLAQRWKDLMSPKGVPFREWLVYTRRHLGWRWPLYAVSPYLKTILGR